MTDSPTASSSAELTEIAHLDTSVLAHDLKLSGVRMSLVRALILSGVPVRISEAAFAEASTRVGEEVGSLFHGARKAVRELNAFGVDSFDAPRGGSEAPAVYVARREFKRRLGEIGIGVVDIPSDAPSHAQVVQRIQAGIRPFSGKPGQRERGYRDYLIWLTLLADAKARDVDRVFFVSSDKGFFDDGELHRDLSREASLAKVNVQAFSTLDQFIEKVIKPRLSTSQTVSALLTDAAKGRLERWLETEVAVELSFEPFPAQIPNVPFSTESETITSVGGVRITSVESVYEIDAETAALTLEIEAELEVEYGVPGSELAAHRVSAAEFDLTELDLGTLAGATSVVAPSDARLRPPGSTYFAGWWNDFLLFQAEIVVRVSDTNLEPQAMSLTGW